MTQFSVTFTHGVEEFDSQDSRYELHAAGALVIDDRGARTTYAAGQWLRIIEDTPQARVY